MSKIATIQEAIDASGELSIPLEPNKCITNDQITNYGLLKVFGKADNQLVCIDELEKKPVQITDNYIRLRYSNYSVNVTADMPVASKLTFNIFGSFSNNQMFNLNGYINIGNKSYSTTTTFIILNCSMGILSPQSDSTYNYKTDILIA